MSSVTAEQLNSTKSSIIEEIKSLSVSDSGTKEQKLFVKDENHSRQTNYVGWSIKTETLLRKKKCLDDKDKLIEGKEAEALNNLISCISDELIEIIPKTKRQSFQTLWDYLPIKCKIGNRWDLERLSLIRSLRLGWISTSSARQWIFTLPKQSEQAAPSSSKVNMIYS